VREFLKSQIVQFVLAAIVLLLLLFTLFRKATWEQIVEALVVTPLWVLLALCLAQLGGLFINGLRWWLLLPKKGFPLKRALSIHFKSSFLGAVLPSSSGQDIIKALYMGSEVGVSQSWAITWVFKLTGFVASFFLSFLSLILLGKNIFNLQGLLYFVVGAFFLLLVLIWVSFNKMLSKQVRSIVQKFLPPKSLQKIMNLREAVFVFRNRRFDLIVTLLVAIFQQVFLLICSTLVIYGVSGKWLPIQVFAFYPLVEILVSLAPLTPGGIGLRESMHAVAYQSMGLSLSQIQVMTILSLVFSLTKLVGILSLFDRVKKSNT